MRAAIALLALLALSAAADAQSLDDVKTCTTVATTLNLTSILVGKTVFCPTEKAFIKAGRKLGVKGKKDELNAKLVTLATANSALFTSILAGHAVAGAVNSTAAASLIGKPAVPTLLSGFGLTFAGKPDKLQIEFPVASLKKNGGGPTTGETKIITPDLALPGIIIHVIDEVMFPKPLEAGLKALKDSIKASGNGRRMLL